jgi:hypothetical protein
MKKALLVAVVLLMVAGVARAQQSDPLGYIGLFTGEDHSYWCASNETAFYPVEVWILCFPGSLGQICAEFMLCSPANVITSTVTWNEPLISVSLGDLDVGLSVCYVACQTDWHWIAHRLYYVTDLTQSYIEICPHPDVGVYQFSNCEDGYPIEPCVKLTHMYLNYTSEDDECKAMGTESASWGAIKAMAD